MDWTTQLKPRWNRPSVLNTHMMTFLENLQLLLFVLACLLTPHHAKNIQDKPVLIESQINPQESLIEKEQAPRELLRDKRQDAGESSSEHPVTEALMEEEEELDPSKQGPSLGFICGVATLVCTVIYIIGITYKLIKIHKGTYVEEEPIFLKYK